MSLTKKDFEKLAEIIREAHVDAGNYMNHDQLVTKLQGAITRWAEEQNPRFDASRFAAACQPKGSN